MNEYHDSILGREELLRFHAVRLEDLEILRKEALHRFASSDGADVDTPFGKLQLELGLHEVECRMLAAVPRLVALAEHLDVLPRHRPRSIPQAAARRGRSCDPSPA